MNQRIIKTSLLGSLQELCHGQDRPAIPPAPDTAGQVCLVVTVPVMYPRVTSQIMRQAQDLLAGILQRLNLT